MDADRESVLLLKDRPLVILLGWLGCNPRHLRRYERLYKGKHRQQRHQFNVVSRVATPWMVVKTSTQSMKIISMEKEDGINIGTDRNTKKDFIKSSSSISAASTTVLGPLLLELINLIQISHAGVLIHVFSNGGVFVWEHLREYWFTTPQRKQRCLGVIFDSSPAFYAGHHDNLGRALTYCTWKERVQIRWNTIYSIWPNSDEAARRNKERHDRAMQFWTSLQNDPWDLRQLYLCSHDDHLADFNMLQSLIRTRQKRFGKHRIWKQVWESSPHCCHLLKHPVEYQEAIAAFLDACLYDRNNEREDGEQVFSKL